MNLVAQPRDVEHHEGDPEGHHVALQPSRAVPRWALPTLLGLFVTLAILYSVVVPPFETPDEIWHFAFIQHVASGQGLPVATPDSRALWRQQGTQAPLYYLTAAALTAWIDLSDFPAIYARTNPHAAIGQPEAQANVNYLVHHPSEAWPWRGSILALHLARLLSVLLGTITLWASYQSVARLVEPRYALVGTAILAFTPQFVFISAAASNDNGVNALAALLIWQLVVLIMAPPAERILPRRLGWIGVTLGAALLSKLSALALVGLAGLVLLGLAWRNRTWRIVWDALIWVGAPVLLIAGWWYARNILLYGDLLAWNIWEANILLRVNPADWTTIASELGSLFRSYWGLFGWLNVPYPDWVYLFFAVVTLLVVTGLLLRLVQQRNQLWRLDGRWWAGALLLLWLLLLTISWLRFMRVAPAAQGRYFFPAAPVLIWLAAQGLAGWRRWILGGAVALLLLLLTAATPAWRIAPAYWLPPSADAVPSTLVSLSVQAEDGVALVGLSAPLLGETTLQPGQPFTLTLAWRAWASPAHDLSVFVHLVDDDGLIVAQTDSMPVGGRAPTSAWQPGETYLDSHTITLPPTAYTPNSARWAVGLYRALEPSQPRAALSAETLPATLSETIPSDTAAEIVENALYVGRVEIATPPSTVPNPLDVSFDDGISLVGYRFNQRRLEPGDTLTVTLYWQARRPIATEYTTFVHLLDGNYQMHGGSDDRPDPRTEEWPVGEVIEDVHSFVLPATTPAGVAQVELGLYTQPDFDRLPLLNADGAEGADRLLLGPLYIAENIAETDAP